MHHPTSTALPARHLYTVIFYEYRVRSDGYAPVIKSLDTGLNVKNNGSNKQG